MKRMEARELEALASQWLKKTAGLKKL